MNLFRTGFVVSLFTLSISVFAIDPPTGLNPCLGGPFDPYSSIYLNWQEPISASDYHVQLSIDPTFNTGQLDYYSGGASSIDVGYPGAGGGLLYDAGYYWRVRATDNGSTWSAWSSGTCVFDTQTAPPPILLNPCGPGQVAFDPWDQIFLNWQGSPAAWGYQIQVASFDPTFIAPDLDITVGVGNTYENVGNSLLNYDTPYYWRVRMQHLGGWSTWSTVCDFMTAPIPIPPAPNLLAPANGSTNMQPGSVGLQWSSAFGFLEELQISTDALFNSPMFINTAGSQHTLTGLLYAQTYYWRVRESNVSGTGPWSPVWSFTTMATTTSFDVQMNLEGPWDPSTQMMNDDLRSASLIPYGQPYSALGYSNIVNVLTNSSVLSVSGPNAIVDWVLLEFRDPDSYSVIERFPLLLQRDGDVVMPDGSALMIDLPQGKVNISMRHRNHLGCMATAVYDNDGSSISLDFTSTGTQLYGTEATSMSSGGRMLWCGDVTNDGTISYTGAGNDRDPILVEIGGSVPTNTTTGYSQEDVNLDGVSSYTGLRNDRDPILVNIGGSTPTETREEQLP